ncbi:MAG: hypothetical protein GF331_18370 [Chitinivibrionales bacterium]|nr:hypothetical protein [Chitinivibrionales bacterium]
MCSTMNSTERITTTPNRRYFQYRGKPIWLSGHSRMWTLTGFMSEGEKALDTSLDDEPYMDEIRTVAEHGGHLMRVTAYWPGDWKRGRPMPWVMIDSGRFDLSRFNDDYWRRLRHFVSECARRDIIVHLEVWDRPGLSAWNETRWPAHPFNPDNNVNYGTAVIAGGDGDVVGGDKPFYRTIAGGNPLLLGHQSAFVDRLLDECEPMPNVIYCIENEGWGGADWECYWARYIRKRVPDALVTAMPHEPTDNTWTTYFDTSTYSCLDGGGTGLRTATRGDDQNHEDLEPRTLRSRTDQFIQLRECMAKYSLYMQYNPDRAMPIYVSNAFGRSRDSIWGMFCCGAAGFRYHRNTWDDSHEVYRWLRGFNRFLDESAVPFAEMAPRHDLLRGYGLLLHNHTTFVAYVPSSHKGASYHCPHCNGTLTLRYFDPERGEWHDDATETVAVGESAVVEMNARNGNATVVMGTFDQPTV